jgi:hypothetical protein
MKNEKEEIFNFQFSIFNSQLFNVFLWVVKIKIKKWQKLMFY